jgi:hypothetical protein
VHHEAQCSCERWLCSSQICRHRAGGSSPQLARISWQQLRFKPLLGTLTDTPALGLMLPTSPQIPAHPLFRPGSVSLADSAGAPPCAAQELGDPWGPLARLVFTSFQILTLWGHHHQQILSAKGCCK